MLLKDTSNYQSVFNSCTTLDISRARDIIESDTEPTPPLWPPMWNEGEICVFFSETNVGKSIVSVQIANDISSGHSSITGEPIAARSILYLDYELSGSQFKSRYSGCRFNDRFYRGHPRLDGIDTLEIDNAVADICRAMEQGYRAIIVDNITYLSNAIKDATNALQLMKTLKAKSIQTGCSLLLIAHTPKRPAGQPISKADIAGSSNILNFADSAFALGESYLDSRLRYLKQIKVREKNFTYDTDRVLVGEFAHKDSLLQFIPITTQNENLHLQ